VSKKSRFLNKKDPSLLFINKQRTNRNLFQTVRE